MQDPERTLNNVVDGLSIGTIWALIALGYTLVYGIIELINFAHGEVFMIGAFVVGLDARRRSAMTEEHGRRRADRRARSSVLRDRDGRLAACST